MVLHAGGSWDHLTVKLQVKIKSAEMVPDDTGGEGEGSSLVPAAGEDDVKAKAKMPVTGILPSQIQWGCSVYDPKMLNKKIGSIKVLSQQPGEEMGIRLNLLGLFDVADWFPVMVSIEKPTEEVVLELERLHTVLQTLENDQELERELKQLGAFLVFENQVSTSSTEQEKRDGSMEPFIHHYQEVESGLSVIRRGREECSVKLQQLSAVVVKEEMEQSCLADYLTPKVH